MFLEMLRGRRLHPAGLDVPGAGDAAGGQSQPGSPAHEHADTWISPSPVFPGQALPGQSCERGFGSGVHSCGLSLQDQEHKDRLGPLQAAESLAASPGSPSVQGQVWI